MCLGKQAAYEAKQVEAKTAAQEREASDADWELRLQQAIDSAEKWTAFANALQADKGKAEGEASSTASQLQVAAQIGQRPHTSKAPEIESCTCSTVSQRVNCGIHL